MFLRSNKRFKDGKEHRYWSVVENRRVAGGRSVQKTLLYLGEINDSDRAGWTRAIEAVDESKQTRQIHLFPEDRTPDPLLKHPTLQLRLAAIDTLYRCHDHLLGHREALFTYLKERWFGLFGASYDIPATDGRELRMKRYTKPEKIHQLLLDQLGLTLPAQPPPEIQNPNLVVETF